MTTLSKFVVPAAFSPRKSGEGTQCRPGTKTLGSRLRGNDGGVAVHLYFVMAIPGFLPGKITRSKHVPVYPKRPGD